jgi:putative transposase
MPRVGRKLSESKTYHVMIRGNERKNIFLDDEDKSRFIDTLYEKNKDKKYAVYAYCLMDNHVHLLINEVSDEISRIMKRINVSYAYYFNKKYGRIGHLFQDRFKSEVIKDETQLLAVARYIHNNPVKAGIVGHVWEYKWSSFNLYINHHSNRADVIEKDLLLEMFSQDRSRAVELFLGYSKQENEDSFIDVKEEASIDKPIQNEIDARLFIADFLKEKNMCLDDLKVKRNVVLREALIIELKNRSNLSVRQMTNLLDLDRNIIQRTK